MNVTNIPVSTSKKTVAGSSRPLLEVVDCLLGKHNESFVVNENANGKYSLGNEHVANEAGCSTFMFKNNPSSFYFKKQKIKQKALKI